jgi:transposase-like protein
MLVCPSCKSSEGVQIEGTPNGPHRWSGRCDPCGHAWDFSDDL